MNHLSVHQLISALLAPGGGTQVSGDSGSGKSVFLQWSIEALVQSFHAPILLIDPKGDLAKKTLLSLLEMGESVRRRVHYVAPGNTSLPIFPLNPLAIGDDHGVDEYTRRARLRCKVSHAAHMVLAYSGDEDFDMKPLLYKWTHRFLRIVAELGMSMADVIHFLNPKSDIFGDLASAVRDELSRTELLELSAIRVEERERLIASTKNRFVNMFENSVMEAHFGTVETRRFRELYDSDSIILLDLESCGHLSEEDITFFANAWLMESLHCVFTVPEQQRRPFFIFVDEAPRLAPSFPLIGSALRIIRGLQCRLVLAHQGASAFQSRKDKR